MNHAKCMATAHKVANRFIQSLLERSLNVDREALAALEHDRWSRWMEHQFSKGTFNADGSWTMPPEFVARWQRQMTTPYAALSEDEKDSDRREVDRTLALLEGERPPS